MSTYDYVISGLGCAGLSLVYYLLDSKLKNKKILVIDSSEKVENDRTWCYWAEKPLDIHPKKVPLIFWDSLSIAESNDNISAPLENLKYYHIKSSDFYREVKDKINSFPNVTFLNDKITKIESIENTFAEVETASSGTFKSDLIFNSIPFSPNKNISESLRQVFIGWKIKSDKAVFETKDVSLMHFVSDQSKRTEFFYILPFTANEALVEYTLYTKEIVDNTLMETKLKAYLENEVGLFSTEYEIIFKESGSIPMTTFENSLPKSQNIIQIGTLAGCSKPSTGYTFFDIQKHCKSIVAELESTGKIHSTSWKRKSRFKFYDNIILNIAVKWPVALPQIFTQMFHKNKANQVLKFLNEETNIWEEIALLSKLNYSIFLKSLLNYEKH